MRFLALILLVSSFQSFAEDKSLNCRVQLFRYVSNGNILVRRLIGSENLTLELEKRVEEGDDFGYWGDHDIELEIRNVPISGRVEVEESQIQFMRVARSGTGQIAIASPFNSFGSVGLYDRSRNQEYGLFCSIR